MDLRSPRPSHPTHNLRNPAAFPGHFSAISRGRQQGDPQNGGDLPMAPAEAVLQPEYISNLAHGQPLLGHRSSSLRDLLRGWKNGSLHQVIQHPSLPPRLLRAAVPVRAQRGRTEVDDLRRNRRTTCVAEPAARMERMFAPSRRPALIVCLNPILAAERAREPSALLQGPRFAPRAGAPIHISPVLVSPITIQRDHHDKGHIKLIRLHPKNILYPHF